MGLMEGQGHAINHSVVGIEGFYRSSILHRIGTEVVRYCLHYHQSRLVDEDVKFRDALQQLRRSAVYRDCRDAEMVGRSATYAFDADEFSASVGKINVRETGARWQMIGPFPVGHPSGKGMALPCLSALCRAVREDGHELLAW